MTKSDLSTKALKYVIIKKTPKNFTILILDDHQFYADFRF